MEKTEKDKNNQLQIIVGKTHKSRKIKGAGPLGGSFPP